MTIAQLPLAEHAELRRELILGERSDTLDRVLGQPIDAQFQPRRAAIAVERREGNPWSMENTRGPCSAFEMRKLPWFESRCSIR